MYLKSPPKPKEYQPGTLVFLPRSSVAYSAFYVVVRTDKEQRPNRIRHACHRIDLETGLPMICPDPRCEGRGLACCAITINGGWDDEVEPLTRDTIELYSTYDPAVLDRKFAKQCLKFAPK